ncbi:hypothetical protein BJ508DRAFT_411200, partial [Ascobolus immersus RN42]
MFPHTVVLAFLAFLTGSTLAASTTSNCNNGVCTTTQCEGGQCVAYNAATGDVVRFDIAGDNGNDDDSNAEDLGLNQEYSQHQQQQQLLIPDTFVTPHYEEVGPLEVLPVIVPDEVSYVEGETVIENFSDGEHCEHCDHSDHEVEFHDDAPDVEITTTTVEYTDDEHF